MRSEKAAIICAGGGMRSAHGAGFLYALATRLRITEPDIIIGSSGDAGGACYYAAGQYESIKHIWCDLISTPKFISFARFWKIMDIDYLIDVVFKQQEPLDTAALMRSPIEWRIPVTNFDTGATRYLGAHDIADPYELLRTAKSVPVFYGKRTDMLGGRYFDGELGPTAEDHILQAIARGAKKILLVSDCPPHTWADRMVMRGYTLTTPSALRHAIMRDALTHTTCLSLPGLTITCVIPEKLPAGSRTRDREKLRATFEIGVHDALAMETELRDFFA